MSAASLSHEVAAAEPRYALVIGNSGYKTAPLVNPKNDANLMASTLSKLGFKVTKLIDADQRRMKRAMLTFSRSLRSSDAIGLFYYAGHGVQVNGENYLIPIGASIKDESEIPIEGLSLNQMFKTMQRAENRINIAILDACRDNPYASTMRGVTRGLASVLAPTGSYIGYATAPGQVAYDGKGKNSPYTRALTGAMRNPGISIEEVFRRTRRQVLSATNGKQTPWESSSLTGVFYFKQKPAVLEGNERRNEELVSGLTPMQIVEMISWHRANEAKTAKDYREFIKNFPAGIFVELARLKLTAFNESVIATGSINKTAPFGNGSQWWPAVTATRMQIPAPNPVSTAALATLLLDAGNALAKNDLARAVALYREAAAGGSPQSMYQLARLYDKGRGVTRSLELSATWYRAGAELNHGPSLNALGNMHEFGEGVDKNLAKALRLYQTASERGDGNGMTSLAYLYATGKGVAKNLKLARKWYLAASRAGVKRAMYNLALMEIRGEGGQIDYKDAARWLTLAVNKKHAGAMRQLAALYEEGKGVKKAPKKAAALLLASFKAGNREARNDLFVRPETWSRATRRQMQRKLKHSGIFRGRTNGFFGSRTRKALLTLLSKK